MGTRRKTQLCERVFLPLLTSWQRINTKSASSTMAKTVAPLQTRSTFSIQKCEFLTIHTNDAKKLVTATPKRCHHQSKREKYLFNTVTNHHWHCREPPRLVYQCTITTCCTRATVANPTLKPSSQIQRCDLWHLTMEEFYL